LSFNLFLCYSKYSDSETTNCVLNIGALGFCSG